MNCEDFKRELETAVEHRVLPDLSEAREHLKRCKRCRTLWEDYDIIERAVAEWAALEDEAPDLSGRVLAVLADERELGRPSAPAKFPSRLIPILAGLTMVALLFLAFFLQRDPGQNPNNIAVVPPEVEEKVNIEQTVEMERVVSDTRAAYESLVNRVTGPFEPLKNENSPGGSGDEPQEPPEKTPEDSSNSVSPHIAKIQSEVMKPLGFLTAVFPSPSSDP